MKRNKIKNKYLALINSKDNVSNKIDKMEKKILKGLLCFGWIVLMLFWSAIPSVVLYFMGINPDSLSDVTAVIITFVNDLLFLGLLVLVYRKDIFSNFKNYFNINFKDNFKMSISYWMTGLVIMVISNYIIAIITNGQLADNEEAVRSMIDIAPLYMAFQVIIYAPISEEIIFRKSIRDIFSNRWIFAIMSGLIFGGLHVVGSITDVAGLLYLIPYMSLGVVFGLLYARTDNIFSTIVVHSLHNSLAFILYLLSV